MLNLPPLVQTIVIAALLIGYIVTFFFQKNKIEILKGTVTALKELTDGQKNHIETYKELVSMDAIKENYEIQKEVYFRRAYDKLGDFFWEVNTEPLFDKIKEFCIFLGHLFFDKNFTIKDRFDEKERIDITITFFPENKNFLDAWYEECRKIFDTQKDRTQ